MDMNTTNNYHWNVPTLNDDIDHSVFNTTFSDIDSKVKTLETTLPHACIKAYDAVSVTASGSGTSRTLKYTTSNAFKNYIEASDSSGFRIGMIKTGEFNNTQLTGIYKWTLNGKTLDRYLLPNSYYHVIYKNGQYYTWE